ncbi:MAG: hypothetical protein ACRED1_08475 [Limisphaerales bacterium]
MKALNSILVLAAAFLAVFGEAAIPAPRHWLGAQIDLLPALMIYAALNTNIVVVSLLAVLGGLWFDSLSADPLGLMILPLIAVGFPIFLQRDLILRELPFAQVVLGGIASAVVPLLAVLLLLSAGNRPMLGWGSLWQWVVMTAGGAAATPICLPCLNGAMTPWAINPGRKAVFDPTAKFCATERKCSHVDF